MPTILWLQAGCCGGETISLLNGAQPDVTTALSMCDFEVLWHRFLEAGADRPLEDVLLDCTEGHRPLDVLVVEGAVGHAPADNRVECILERPLSQWIVALAARARFVMAVGTCASYGGVMLCGPRREWVSGLQFRRERRAGLLGAGYLSAGGLPVINVPGCPAHPDWMLCTLQALGGGCTDMLGLDRFQRPRVFFSRLAHHACPRNEYYEFKSSAEAYSQQGCLFENLGCKGTQCESDCNERLWLNGTGSCTRGGFPCLSCTSPLFPDGFTPFFETQKIGGIPTSLPLDVPKAWYVGISGLSKLACPDRLRRSAVDFRRVGSDPEGEQGGDDGGGRADDPG